MPSCTFEELVARVADMLSSGVSRENIDQILEMLSPAYRAEVLAAARDLRPHDRAGQP